MSSLQLEQVYKLSDNLYKSSDNLQELEEMKKLMNELRELNELQESMNNLVAIQHENISKINTTIESTESNIQNVNTELKQAEIYQSSYLSKMRLLLMGGVITVTCPIGVLLGAKVALITSVIGGSGAYLATMK